MIDPGALRALTQIAATGSVAAAADALGFTPSAVSQQVKRLEAAVGVPLLSRSGRGVVLTAAGESLVTGAPEVFSAMERATAAALATSAEPRGTLRVVGFSTAIRGLLAPALPLLADRHPDLHVVIDEADPAEAAATVAAGAADLALLHDSADLPAWSGTTPVRRALRTEELMVDVGDVIVRRDHRLAEAGVVTATDLRGDAWVTSPPGTACHDWFQRLFARSPRPEVRHRIDDFSTQLALVEGGGVIALVPRLARPTLPSGLAAVAVSPLPMRRVEAAWRASSEGSPTVAAALGTLRTLRETVSPTPDGEPLSR